MNILIIHQGFPGQFIHLIDRLHTRGDNITAILPSRVKKQVAKYSYVDFHFYKLQRGNSHDIHPLALETETKVLRGEATAQIASILKSQGYMA